jgi:hypothetical protein
MAVMGDQDVVAITIRVQGDTHLLPYGLTGVLIDGCDITRIRGAGHSLDDGRR